MEEPHLLGGHEDLRNFKYVPSIDRLNGLIEGYLKLPKMDAIARQMLSLEMYDLAYGIQKGDGTESPISLCTMKDTTDFIIESEWRRTIKVLMKLKLHTVTGLNIYEQLDLPMHRLKELIDVASEIGAEEAPIMNKLGDEAEKAGKDRANR